MKPTTVPGRDTGPEVEEVVELLSDDHTREIVEALTNTEQTAGDIRAKTTASKCTVYRRLNALEEADIVEVSYELCSDGHHAKTFSLVPCSVTIDIGGEGLDGEVDARKRAKAAD